MKKILFLSSVVLMMTLLFNACTPESDLKQFDEALLFGTWKSETLYYTYLEDYTGSTWDAADDVKEEEAQKFTWTLDNAVLKQIHIMEMGGNVPKTYTVLSLTKTTLRYKDVVGGKEYTFQKIK